MLENYSNFDMSDSMTAENNYILACSSFFLGIEECMPSGLYCLRLFFGNNQRLKRISVKKNNRKKFDITDDQNSSHAQKAPFYRCLMFRRHQRIVVGFIFFK